MTSIFSRRFSAVSDLGQCGPSAALSLVLSIILPCLILLALCGLCHAGTPGKEVDVRNCLSCHKGIENISIHHRGSCTSCHLKPEMRSKTGCLSHRQIVRNPSDPAYVKVFCSKCHEKEVQRVSASLHSTMAGVINQVRYLWGAQKSAYPARYGLGGPSKLLPEPSRKIYPDKPALLVDDFLRRRCLRCHIHSGGTSGTGLYRASGCAACHVLYADDGLYHGKDRAIPKDRPGYPITHSFTTRIPDGQCLHCHNHNHVGADYEGLFEQDYAETYRSPFINGKPLPRRYGLGYHHLARDVHRRKGLWCIDCHSLHDVMGDGKAYSFEMQVPMRGCSECHGGFGASGPDLSSGDIEQVSGKFVFIPGNGKRRYILTLFSKEPVAHRIKEHKRVRCSACHAQWSFQDYGLSVIREDLSQGFKWYGLTAQGDPYLERKLEESMTVPPGTPVFSKDRITGLTRLGIWSEGWRFRRWEWMPLGVDQNNHYSVLRPLYQFLVSYVDRLGNIALDSVIPERGDGKGRGWAFVPYVPHTIAPEGRACEACHGNPIAAGVGAMEHLTGDARLMIPSPPAISSMRLLNQDERNRLMKPSKRYWKLRLEAILGGSSATPEK